MTTTGDKNFCGIAISTADYDDTNALRAFVAKHCRHFMTPLERRTTEYSVPLTSDVSHDKFRRLYHHLEQRDGHVDDAETVAAFDFSETAREKNAVDRVIRECYYDLPLNRCPKCARLVRTPIAKQCLWCGHDWHNCGEP